MEFTTPLFKWDLFISSPIQLLASSSRIWPSWLSPCFSLFSPFLWYVNLHLHRVLLTASPQKRGFGFEKQDIRRGRSLRVSGAAPSTAPSTSSRARLLVLGKRGRPARSGSSRLLWAPRTSVFPPSEWTQTVGPLSEAPLPADPSLPAAAGPSAGGALGSLLHFRSWASCFLSPSASCCPAPRRSSLTHKQLQLAAGRAVSLYFHLTVSSNCWPQLFHGDPDTWTAAAHDSSVSPPSSPEGEADIFIPLNFYFQAITLPPCVRQTERWKEDKVRKPNKTVTKIHTLRKPRFSGGVWYTFSPASS